MEIMPRAHNNDTPRLIDTPEETPVMAQYRRLKEEHPGEILFFRLGDFYEMFNDDAQLVAPLLGLVLTARNKEKGREIPMCGVPYHSAQTYIARLVKAGHRVAICEQVELPGKGKKLLERQVTRVVTASTLDESLEGKESSFLAILTEDDNGWGLVELEPTAGDFLLLSFTHDEQELLIAELANLSPRELRYININEALLLQLQRMSLPIELLPSHILSDTTSPLDTIRRHLSSADLTSLELTPALLAATAASLRYLAHLNPGAGANLQPPRRIYRAEYLPLDQETRLHLSLDESVSGRSDRTLWRLLDKCRTSMGSRLLRKWILRPLVSSLAINRRLDAVEELYRAGTLRHDLDGVLLGIPDLERLLGRAAARRATGRELALLARAGRPLNLLRQISHNLRSPALQELACQLPDLRPLFDLLNASIAEAPPAALNEPGTIRQGYSPELDELRLLSTDCRSAILEIEQAERKATGINSLRIGWNRVAGYFIEVTKSNLSSIPEERYHRKGYTTTTERFSTEELDRLADRITSAGEKALALEQELFSGILLKLLGYSGQLNTTAVIVADLDCLVALARAALEGAYVRPVVDDSTILNITEGRHPLVEHFGGMDFIPNDTMMEASTARLAIVTGPNMGGKSTYLRQIGLIVLMAQMGSFVPASSAHIGVTDRIFTRVGAGDDLAAGRSTFLVEMSETARILTAATPRSLVLLDEIGRGTSTFDGLALAWAVAEHIHESPQLACRTVFATHFHELTRLADTLPAAFNLTVKAREEGGSVKFLYKVEEGTADRSYGIHVAKLAGLPSAVTKRAWQILLKLEEEGSRNSDYVFGGEKVGSGPLLPPDPHEGLLERLRRIDPDEMTPREAHELLRELKVEWGEDQG